MATVAVLPVDTERDAAEISELYNYYILNTSTTFEEKPISSAEAADRIRTVRDAGYPWLVARSHTETDTAGSSRTEPPTSADNALIGYAYAGPWKPRPAYRHCCEVSIYIAPGNEGCGVGSTLYAALLPELGRTGMHTALAGITLPNPSSIALHEKFGFHKVAQLEQVGFKFGRWIDVGYWELILSSS